MALGFSVSGLPEPLCFHEYHKKCGIYVDLGDIRSSIVCIVKRSSRESAARLFAIAESQGGFFTAKQAEEAGFTRAHHDYHVRVGNWQREHRGIYRLTQFPMSERADLVLWSLWSRNRAGESQGVYSHQTALSIYDLSDLMPSRLHITVPHHFRRSAEIPPILELHHGELSRAEVDEREGYCVTRPIRTIVDVAQDVSPDILAGAFSEARARGLITEVDIERYGARLPDVLRSDRKRPKAI